ncbi:hypothetical protein KSS87_020706 [Heliosperma pusillum]|nr:hypothetical protein KSS87_020706 [Heliosperma pusillum]
MFKMLPYFQEQENINEMSNSSNPEKGTTGIERRESDSIHHTRITKILNPVSSTCDGESCGNSFPLPFELRASPTVAECISYGTQEINATDSLVLPSLAKVKDEPIDTSELYDEGGKSGIQDCTTSSEILCMKSEPSFFDSMGDELDHLPLVDRIKLLSSGAPKPNIDMLDNLESLKNNVDTRTRMPESVSIIRPLKRRRTATNSVETALEEDAPELLKVLRESGILVDDMKLYGEEDSDGELDDSLNDDGFSELEAVISQFAVHIPISVGAKDSLFFSFGICCFLTGKPFSSFLFYTRGVQKSVTAWLVFFHLWSRQDFCGIENGLWNGAGVETFSLSYLYFIDITGDPDTHELSPTFGLMLLNVRLYVLQCRIVLERPEYGYATYFFELLNSVPAAWQIKRLVTALKLTSCGRITLMENKPLVVGEDLSEGEARVLAEYGWTPNTGLGTMLNYCDRVVHDRKNEMNSSEWRSKIGKQLMNGYNGGNIVSRNLLNKSKEDQYLQEEVDVQVKLEQ